VTRDGHVCKSRKGHCEVAMTERDNIREELELLCSRALDDETLVAAGLEPELSDAERERLEAALRDDADLRAFSDSLRDAHTHVNLFAAAHSLPADFRDRVLAHARPEAPIFRLNWASLAAAAAAVVIVAGLFGLGNFLTPGGKTHDRPEISLDRNGKGTAPAIVEAPAPGVHVVAFSRSEIEVVDGNGRVTRGTEVQAKFVAPVTVRAPQDSHAVVQLGEGTAVLAPGSSARLDGMDALGQPDVEPMDGDVYLESWARTKVRSRVQRVPVSVDKGGVTLRRTETGYRAEPSYGDALVGDAALSYRECAWITADGVTIAACDPMELDDWAIAGRADAIRMHVRTLLGDRFDLIEASQWDDWDRMLRGVLSRPAERATHAYTLRFLLKYDFFEGSTEGEIEAWSAIASIMAEGTTEADIPVPVFEIYHRFEKQIETNPELLDQVKRMLRDYMEHMAEQR